jgi:hypothetical protein
MKREIANAEVAAVRGMRGRGIDDRKINIPDPIQNALSYCNSKSRQSALKLGTIHLLAESFPTSHPTYFSFFRFPMTISEKLRTRLLCGEGSLLNVSERAPRFGSGEVHNLNPNIIGSFKNRFRFSLDIHIINGRKISVNSTALCI